MFVSVDPARDSVPQVKKYLSGKCTIERVGWGQYLTYSTPSYTIAEFHPKMIGLTGPYDAVKKMCKVFRVYFSTPPEVKEGKARINFGATLREQLTEKLISVAL